MRETVRDALCCRCEGHGALDDHAEPGLLNGLGLVRKTQVWSDGDTQEVHRSEKIQMGRDIFEGGRNARNTYFAVDARAMERLMMTLSRGCRTDSFWSANRDTAPKTSLKSRSCTEERAASSHPRSSMLSTKNLRRILCMGACVWVLCACGCVGLCVYKGHGGRCEMCTAVTRSKQNPNDAPGTGLGSRESTPASKTTHTQSN